MWCYSLRLLLLKGVRRVLFGRSTKTISEYKLWMVRFSKVIKGQTDSLPFNRDTLFYLSDRI